MILSLYPEAYQTWNFLENLELSSKLQVFVLLCPQIFIGNCLGKTDFTNSQLVRLQGWRKRGASENSEDISSGSKFGGSVKLQKTLRIYQLRLQVWRKREASENSEDISSGSKFGSTIWIWLSCLVHTVHKGNK